MNPNRPIDSKREEYRKYLERTGVLDALTKLLTHLYEEPEKPSDGLKFIHNFLGESFPDVFKLQSNASELDEEREKVRQLTEEIKVLEAKLAVYETEKPTEVIPVESEAVVPINPGTPEPDPEPPQVPEAEQMAADSSEAAL